MTKQGDGTDGAGMMSIDPAGAAQATKIERLREAIERGEYSIEEQLIAEKMIAQGALDNLN